VEQPAAAVHSAWPEVQLVVVLDCYTLPPATLLLQPDEGVLLLHALLHDVLQQQIVQFESIVCDDILI
jgi:hypothetical protein